MRTKPIKHPLKYRTGDIIRWQQKEAVCYDLISDCDFKKGTYNAISMSNDEDAYNLDYYQYELDSHKVA